MRGTTTTSTHLQRAPGGAQAPSFRVGVPVILRFGGRDRSRTATAVSLEGLFVESPDALPIGELVLAWIDLGDERGAVRALLTVERVVMPAESAFCGGLPGMGLRFFLMDSELRAGWVTWVHHLEEVGTTRLVDDPKAVEHRREVVQTPGTPRRSGPRRQGRFRVRMAEEQLAAFYTRNVSKGGLFLATQAVQPTGTVVELSIHHPISRRTFDLRAEVRWVRDSGPPEEWGMGLAFDRADERSDEWLAFMNQGKSRGSAS